MFRYLPLLVVMICSCSGRQSEQSEIKFWALGAEGENVVRLIPGFEHENPEIKVKVQMFPWTAAQEKLITAFASNNLPDLFQLGNTWIPQFAALNALEELNPYIDQSDYIRETSYFKGIWDTNLLDSSCYGLPWYIDTRVLFYRTDVLHNAGFDHAPRTWDELYLISKRIKERAGDPDKYAIFLPTNEWAQFVIFGLQNDAILLKENNCYGNFSSTEFKTAFEFLTRFAREQLSPLGVRQVTNVYQAFAEEYFVMYISGPWNIPEFKKWMTDSLADRWMTAVLPGPHPGQPGISLAGGSSLVLSRRSENKNAGWKLMEYLSRVDIQLQFFRMVNDLPARIEAWEDPLLRDDPYMQAFFDQFHHVVPMPKVPEWEQIAYSKIQQYAELAARDIKPVDRILEELDNDVNRILEKRRWLIQKNGTGHER